jgi:ribosomal protein L11 methylase PrmA
MSVTTVPGSFRDPAGFLYRRDTVLYRQVDAVYAEHYALLTDSGLYRELAEAGLLVGHEEVEHALAATADAFKVLRPDPVPFISYPYEWCFSQLKDAALLTLEIQRRALEKGLSLRDASAYNVQFIGARPVFIDTLSFEKYREGEPWVAYRQFCQHFLAPLALMSRTDVRLGQLMRVYIDGVPLDLASRLLPALRKWNLSLGLHIGIHARSQKRYADSTTGKKNIKGGFSRRAFVGLLDSLRSAVAKLDWQPGGTEWHDYYEANNNYSDKGLQKKERLVSEILAKIAPRTVWDLGANTGRFSRIASAAGAQTVAWDIDPGCVESNYRMAKERGEQGVLPLLLDLTNPSAGIGWANTERQSFIERAPVDCILSLGLIHHLAISNNVPLGRIAQLFRSLSRNLVIEFVPKQDSQVQKLLATREDIFPTYDQEGFEQTFGEYFDIERAERIEGTSRTLFWLKGKDSQADAR